MRFPMNKGQTFYQVLSDLVWVGQLGLNLISPLLLCLVLCWWLTTRWGFPLWLYIPGFFLGMGGGFSSAAQFYRLTMKRSKGDKPTAFNQHR